VSTRDKAGGTSSSHGPRPIKKKKLKQRGRTNTIEKKNICCRVSKGAFPAKKTIGWRLRWPGDGSMKKSGSYQRRGPRRGNVMGNRGIDKRLLGGKRFSKIEITEPANKKEAQRWDRKAKQNLTFRWGG